MLQLIKAFIIPRLLLVVKLLQCDVIEYSYRIIELNLIDQSQRECLFSAHLVIVIVSMLRLIIIFLCIKLMQHASSSHSF